MTENNQIPESFPLLRAHARHAEKFDQAISALHDGMSNRSIRKTVFDDLKYVFGRAFEKAWKNHFNERFTYAGKFRDLPEDVRDLEMSVSLNGINSAIAIMKKIDKFKRSVRSGVSDQGRTILW